MKRLRTFELVNQMETDHPYLWWMQLIGMIAFAMGVTAALGSFAKQQQNWNMFWSGAASTFVGGWLLHLYNKCFDREVEADERKRQSRSC